VKSLSVKLGVILIGLILFGYTEVCNAQNWVLWVGKCKKVDSKTEWTIDSAYPSYEKCVERLQYVCGHPGLDPMSWTCSKYKYLGYATWYLKCFPDTIDPRK